MFKIYRLFINAPIAIGAGSNPGGETNKSFKLLVFSFELLYIMATFFIAGFCLDVFCFTPDLRQKVRKFIVSVLFIAH
jgi:hypothetical protein